MAGSTKTWVNGSAPSCEDDDLNGFKNENNNLIQASGQSLNTGDNQQTNKAVSHYAAAGNLYTDSGAVNAYVLTADGSRVAPDALFDGMRVAFVPGSTNTGASTVNAAGLGVVDFRDRYGNALDGGELIAGQVAYGVYDFANGWFTQDNALNEQGASRIQPIDASVAANALTVTINPTILDFRSNSLTDGTINTRIIPAAISMVVSNGSNLGMVNGIGSRLPILAIDNAGTIETAIVNLAGGNNLDETTLISTTAEGGAGGADSANVIYSTVARSNVPFRVVGFIDITEATAGTWATGPTTVQGAGGNAITAMQSLGYSQKWQDVTGSRSLGVSYYNDTGRPIFVSVTVNPTAAAAYANSLNIDGAARSRVNADASSTSKEGTVYGIVPPGSVYTTAPANATLLEWNELR